MSKEKNKIRKQNKTKHQPNTAKIQAKKVTQEQINKYQQQMQRACELPTDSS